MIEDPPTSKIPGLGKLSVELLGAVGILRASQIARANVDVLHLDLMKANKALLVRKKDPSLKEISKWIELACGITGIEEGETSTELDQFVKVKKVAEVEEVFMAIPVPGQRLSKQGVKATDIPIMKTVMRESIPVPTRKPLPKPRPVATSLPEPVLERKEAPIAARPIPGVSKKVPLSLSEKRAEIAPLESTKKNDIRVTASSNLNEGRKLHSRRFIRGVLHPGIGKIRVSALITILMFAMMPMTLVAGGMIMFTKNLWWAAAPASFLLILFLYAVVAGGAKCRICGQPVFKPKNCRKHVKAHRLFGLGYILPTSLHMILFHWYRCIYCGTSVRLKK